ncbi:ATP-binding protein [Acidocella sp.]|uniref:ATP-binding protein n=1 Tax=Acidocella sp. TaxID=50710 RepID=UPI003D085054
MADTEEASWERAGPAAFALFLALAAVPSVVFALLTFLGELRPPVALAAWAVCSLVAVGFALLLGRDIMVMTRLVRALRTAPEALPVDRHLMVPGMSDLGAEALRLIHAERLLRGRHVANAAEDRALVERLPDPLMKLDADGRVLWRNDSALIAFGTETAALLRHPDIRAALAEVLSGGKPVRREIVLAVPMKRDLEITMIPVGGPLYMLVSDRTRERALEKMRADFIANSSHELRTPLASLIGFIETLRGPAADDPEAQQKFLSIMAEQAARMQNLIGDLLSLSKIEISEHSPPKDLLHLPPLLERIAAGMEPMLKAQGTTLVMEAPDALPQVPADADQLTQVFTNLLDNALKYGKPGGVIRLNATAVADTRFPPGGVALSVADDGIGIPREHIPRLTERFYRVDKGRSRAIGGTGLGLAIVKHVVNRHRGRLIIDSDPGQGTVFTIWLPGQNR